MTDGAGSADEAAVAWFVILQDEEVTDEQRRAFEAWRTAAPENARAWSELERMWGALDALAPAEERPVAPVDATREAAVIPLRPAALEQPTRQQPVRGWHPAAIAAALLIAVGIGMQTMPVGFWSDYRTSVGERRVIALDDGSAVELGSASALDVDFGSDARRVTLVAGEAFFTVAKDPARPFVVGADGGEIAVRGTAFNVKIASNVAVAVTQNAVDVKTAGSSPVRVAEGYGVHYDARTVSLVTAVDLDAVQAWRHDQLIFHDARLEDVLAELQRYRRGYIQLLSSDLADRRVTAVFDARRPDAALETIARSLDLRLYRATDMLIAIAAN